MRRSIIALGAGLLLSLSATSISANPVMPLGALAASSNLMSTPSSHVTLAGSIDRPSSGTDRRF